MIWWISISLAPWLSWDNIFILLTQVILFFKLYFRNKASHFFYPHLVLSCFSFGFSFHWGSRKDSFFWYGLNFRTKIKIYLWCHLQDDSYSTLYHQLWLFMKWFSAFFDGFHPYLHWDIFLFFVCKL